MRATSSPSNRDSAMTKSTDSPERADSGHMSESLEPSVWISILSKFQQVRDITLKVNGDPSWTGRTEVENTLVTLRVALEMAQLPHLRDFHLKPIHAMGIIHLRWSGFGAFGTAPASSCDLWRNLHTLNVQLKNPYLSDRKLSESQQTMFTKILHDYLRSFATTLKCLRFIWIGGDGPSPITLDLEPALHDHRKAITWAALEEVWLGNIELPQRTITLLPNRVTKPGVRLKMLRSIHRYSSEAWKEDESWVNVLLKCEPHGMKREDVRSQSSSLYSQ